MLASLALLVQLPHIFDADKPFSTLEEEELITVYPEVSHTIVTADPDGAGPWTSETEHYEEQWVLDWNDEASEKEIIASLEPLGLTPYWNSIYSEEPRYTLVDVPKALQSDFNLWARKNELLEGYAPNQVFRPAIMPGTTVKHNTSEDKKDDKPFPNDPRFPEQWHMQMIGVEQAWELSPAGKGVIVAVIDTGVAYEDAEGFHQVEDLNTTKFVPGYDFVNRRPEAYDDHAHGTHVAGTIAQSTHNGRGVVGVAYNAKIMPIKVLSGSGGGSLAGVAEGIRFAADHGATVMNLSLGASFPDPITKAAVEYAAQKDVAIICAAGNSAVKKSGYPAGYPGSTSISAVGPDKKLSFYTNYGPTIDFAAPGGDMSNYGEAGGVLQNTISVKRPMDSGYYFFQGTSMATPHAAGIAALIASGAVTSKKGIDNALRWSAEDFGRKGREEGYGSGLLQADEAVSLVLYDYNYYKLTLAGIFLSLPLALFIRNQNLTGIAPLLLGATIGATGLFLLHWIPGLSVCASSWGHSLADLDFMLLGANSHGNPLFQSLLLPAAMSLLFVNIRPLRDLTSGLIVGYLGHFACTLYTQAFSVLFMPTWATPVWLLANIVFGLFLLRANAQKLP